jgi:transcription elongation factor Elf1
MSKKVECLFCHSFNTKKTGENEYTCKKCNLTFFYNKNTVHRGIESYNFGSIESNERDNYKVPDFYLQPEKELNFDHDNKKRGKNG